MRPDSVEEKLSVRERRNFGFIGTERINTRLSIRFDLAKPLLCVAQPPLERPDTCSRINTVGDKRDNAENQARNANGLPLAHGTRPSAGSRLPGRHLVALDGRALFLFRGALGVEVDALEQIHRPLQLQIVRCLHPFLIHVGL